MAGTDIQFSILLGTTIRKTYLKSE